MKRHWILPAVAAVMFVYAIGHALYIQRPDPEYPPPVPPPSTPFGNTVAGAGIIEPATVASGTSAIAVGTQTSGLVTAVHVAMGQEVKAGQVLFELDRRTAEATLKAQEAAVIVAQANLRKLELQPRPEEVPISEATVAAALASYRQQHDQVERDKQLDRKTLAPQDRVAHEEALRQAEWQLAQARASLALLKAGAWEPDKKIAYANLELARAQVEQARVALELLTIRAPIDGTILQVNVRPGEYVSAAPGAGLVLMGSLRPMHVRVSIDEEDLPRLLLNRPAHAKVRGDLAQEEVPLTFVRLEPYVVPKTSLTGANTERVDTRVVQLIYALDPGHHLVREKRMLVGQLVDVFIDTQPRAGE